MAMNRTASPVEHLTWDAICARHPDCWVILADIGWVNDTDFEFTWAEVVATFPDRKAASPTVKALIAAGREAGCFWTGEQMIPKGDSPALWRLRQ
jgi:hypothetical protein